MSLKETYFANLGNVKKMDPEAVIIDVTRRAGSVLSPSWYMLNDYKAGKMTWDGYISRFLREMDNPECKTEMLKIGELARTKEVYLVCFERVGNCHRFLLVDMIKRAMIIEACRRMNLVKSGYDNIAKALPVEA
jgi:uncharacterized protein YeaO (DUF488 family)